MQYCIPTFKAVVCDKGRVLWFLACSSLFDSFCLILSVFLSLFPLPPDLHHEAPICNLGIFRSFPGPVIRH